MNTTIPSADAFKKLPRQQLLELQERIQEALGGDRPSIHHNENHMGVRMTLEEKTCVRELAWAHGTTVSDVLRTAVRRHLEHEAGSILAAIKGLTP
jgi:hypothetical protein